MKLTRADWCFVIVLLLFAAGLRFVGLAYGQPDPQYNTSLNAKQMLNEQTPLHPDEYFNVTIPVEMLVKRDLNPHWFEYPSFLMNVNFVTFWLTGTGNGLSADNWKGVSSRAFAPFPLYGLVRVYSVLGGLLTVAATYALTWRLAGRWAAAAAGLLMAVSFTLVEHAHYATQSSISGGLAALTIWASLVCLQAKRPPLRLFVLAGVAAGFAAGCRYNVAAVSLVVFGVGCVLLYRQRSWRLITWVLLGWCAVPAAFLFSTPYAVLDFQTFMEGFRYLTGQYLSTGVNVQSIFIVNPWVGLGIHYRNVIVFALGVPASLAVPLGLYASWQTRRSHPIRFTTVSILLLYLVPYSLVVLRTLRPYDSDHLAIPILPVLGVFAGIGVHWLYQRLPTAKGWLVPGLLVALVVVPLSLSLSMISLFTQRDTRYLMQEWIYQHIPRGTSVLLSGPYNVPLDAADYHTKQIFVEGIVSPEKLQGFDYVIRSDAFRFAVERVAANSADYGRIQEFDDWLDRSFVKIAHIERPTWVGYDWDLNSVSYWYHPGLTVYCLTQASCTAAR